MKHSKLFYWIMAGALLGFVLGAFFGEAIGWFSIFGELFLNALKGLVMPLVIFSVISGIASLKGAGTMGRLGIATIFYYMITTAFAVVIGILLVNLIEPGQGMTASASFSRETQFSFKDVILGLISPNIFASLAEMKILPMIVLSIALALALLQLGDKGDKILESISTLNEAILKIVGWIMLTAPLGICSLVAERFSKAGGYDGILAELEKIGLYAATVVLALLVHALFVLAPLLWSFSKEKPLAFFRKVSPALLTAFSTASSSASLPITLDCCEKEAGLSKKTTRFVAPLGATINMDGTALYEAVAAIFIAQVYGIELSLGQELVIFLTATLAAIGAAGIPEAGLITMILVLQSVGLPVEGIGLLLAIDWLLDRFRTTINVWGDMVGCAVLQRFVK